MCALQRLVLREEQPYRLVLHGPLRLAPRRRECNHRVSCQVPERLARPPLLPPRVFSRSRNSPSRARAQDRLHQPQDVPAQGLLVAAYDLALVAGCCKWISLGTSGSTTGRTRVSMREACRGRSSTCPLSRSGLRIRRGSCTSSRGSTRTRSCLCGNGLKHLKANAISQARLGQWLRRLQVGPPQ